MGSVDSKPNNVAGIQCYNRRAHHAGSWYVDEEEKLREALEDFLRDASPSTTELSSAVRALIVPHAGYSYSGPTAAFAYAALRQELARSDTPIRKILVLHPSHKLHLPQQCAVSQARILHTPLGDLQVDDELRHEILCLNSCSTSRYSKQQFTVMTASEDEREHSGEMQYPYLACCIPKNKNITVLPVMCGALSTESETFFGERLREIIHRPEIITIISTDFCHWGRRFDYQPTPNSTVGTDSSMPIHDFIEQMDRRGMDLIAAQEPGAFAMYLKETRNTICGRHAVAVWLRAVASNSALSVDFVRYVQSSPSTTLSDSSVSYAAAVITTKTVT